jgi:hypothetical protein
MARMNLIMAQLFRNAVCKQVANWVYAPAITGESATKDVVNPFDSTFNAYEAAKAVAPEVLEKAFLSDAVIEKTVKVGQTLITRAVSGVPVVGGLLSGIVEVVSDSVSESAKFAAEFYMHYGKIGASYNLLIDLINPRMCMQQYAMQMNKLKRVYDTSRARQNAI